MTLVRQIEKDTAGILFPALKQLEPEYIADSYATTLAQVFARLKNGYADLEAKAAAVSVEFTERVNKTNRKKFDASVKNIVGVDVSSVIQQENITDILTATTQQNVSLITSIPDEYFKDLESIIWTGVTQGNPAESMIDQIIGVMTKEGNATLNEKTKNRARLIARDQTKKLNSALVHARQENLGIVEYIWRTSEDGRVRPEHAANNGKTFRWDSPPATGHPGEDIQCRCYAEAILPF